MLRTIINTRVAPNDYWWEDNICIVDPSDAWGYEGVFEEIGRVAIKMKTWGVKEILRPEFIVDDSGAGFRVYHLYEVSQMWGTEKIIRPYTVFPTNLITPPQ